MADRTYPSHQRDGSHNAAVEAQQLAEWQTQPERMLAYYAFPAEDSPLFGRPRTYRATFNPCLHSYVNKTKPEDTGVANVATVATWTGATLGTITSARVYSHNFGGRMVSLRVKGTNGVEYYGRASWDNGSCVWLRKVK